MFNRIRNRFRSKQNVPDLIEALDLQEWYLNLSNEQRQKLHRYSTWFGTNGENNMLEQSLAETSQTTEEYLKGVGSTAASKKDYEFAETILLSALEFEDDSATSTHFTYTALIDVYYKQRNDRKDAIKNCIEYCKKDIEIADDFISEFGMTPRIPSFKRLAIIYEKNGKYEDAIGICDQALEIGTIDGTKGGFEGRKERLQKKVRNE